MEQRPKPSELQRTVLQDPEACAEWENVGIGLDLADDDAGMQFLEEVERKFQRDDKRLLEVVKKWLRSPHLQQTWGRLLETLNSLGLREAVRKIEEQILGHVLVNDKVPMNEACSPHMQPGPSNMSPQPPPAATPPGCPPPSSNLPEQAAVKSKQATQPVAGATKRPKTEQESSNPVSNSLAGRQEKEKPAVKAEQGFNSPAVTSIPPGVHRTPDLPPHANPVHNPAPTSSPGQMGGGGSSVSPYILPTPVPEPAIDYSIKMEEGQTVRQYQKELAQPGISGENYIIVAPTGSGKTLVAALVISVHLSQCQSDPRCHVVFVVNTKPLAEQQGQQLSKLIPAARVGVYTGDSDNMVANSIKERNNISVCTAGKLLDEIRRGKVGFDQLSLMVFDECHHAKKGHPYARLMEHYLEHRDEEGGRCPQIIGMTASPGAGNNSDLEKEKTIDHLLVLVARLDATAGLRTVAKPENLQELQRSMKNSSFSLKVMKPREAAGDPFVCRVEEEMSKLEKTAVLGGMKINSLKRWSQEYETMVQQHKLPLESGTDRAARDQISALNLLRCYSNVLSVYMDLQQKDAIKVMTGYRGLPEDLTRATHQERSMKESLEALLQELGRLPARDNPILEEMKGILCDNFTEKPDSRAIIFVRTKKHAYSLRDWVTEHDMLITLISPGVITGHTRETGAGMTQAEQEEVMSSFRKGETNLLIATSVAEEGLDVPECNLVIRFQHVSNEIAKVQTEGRARAENSQGFTILPSDSKKKNQELKNSELVLLVEEILENNWFPSGAHLRTRIAKIQREIMNERKLKALRKETLVQRHANSQVRLFCRQCKEFACYGSDIYTIGEASFHYVVPSQQFQAKTMTKPCDKQVALITNEVLRTHKIHCGNCEKHWGVKCIWPHNGHTFPVIKCSSFNFEINGVPSDIKKWSNAPFEMEPLSSWLEKTGGSDTSLVESD